MSVFLIAGGRCLLARHDFLSGGIAGTAHFDFVMVKKNKHTIFVNQITAVLYIEREIFCVFGSRRVARIFCGGGGGGDAYINNRDQIINVLNDTIC